MIIEFVRHKTVKRVTGLGDQSQVAHFLPEIFTTSKGVTYFIVHVGTSCRFSPYLSSEASSRNLSSNYLEPVLLNRLPVASYFDLNNRISTFIQGGCELDVLADFSGARCCMAPWRLDVSVSSPCSMSNSDAGSRMLANLYQARDCRSHQVIPC